MTMATRSIDRTGVRYGMLTALSRADTGPASAGAKAKTKWLCRCDCGNEKVILSNNLASGTSKSCGCVFGSRNGNGFKDLTYEPGNCRWATMLAQAQNRRQRTN